MRPERRNVLILVALSAILGFAFQGSRGLYETTKGRYAESTRAMLETGDRLVPRLDYAPHGTKPPLAYWAIAGGMALFGTNEWGARFSNAAAFILTVLAVSALACAAIIAAVVTAAALVAVKGANARYPSDLDMKALHGACPEASRGETAFFLFESQELLGLQFYLDGRLTRVAAAASPRTDLRETDGRP